METLIKKLFDLTGRTAIITGGIGMLGTVYTAALAAAGANVAAVDKSGNEQDFLKLLEKEFGLSASTLQRIRVMTCDITKPDQVDITVGAIDKEFGNIMILINNASVVKQVGRDELASAYKPFLEMNKTDWEEYFSVDLTGGLLMSQKVIPYMQKSGSGAIVNISSTYGIQSPDQRLYQCFHDQLSDEQKAEGMQIEKPIGYSVSKSGVLNLTRHLATQFAPVKIRVNTLTPGGVYANNPKEFIESYAHRTPLGRMADKLEYIGPILFLVSDASSYMTGANLVVDGGWGAW